MNINDKTSHMWKQANHKAFPERWATLAPLWGTKTDKGKRKWKKKKKGIERRGKIREKTQRMKKIHARRLFSWLPKSNSIKRRKIWGVTHSSRWESVTEREITGKISSGDELHRGEKSSHEGVGFTHPVPRRAPRRDENQTHFLFIYYLTSSFTCATCVWGKRDSSFPSNQINS